MSTVCVNVTLPLQSGLSPIGSPYRPGCRESGPRTASGLGKDNRTTRPRPAPARAPRPRPPAPRPPGQAWRPTRTHKPTHTFSRVFHIIPVLSFSFLTITMKHTHLAERHTRVTGTQCPKQPACAATTVGVVVAEAGLERDRTPSEGAPCVAFPCVGRLSVPHSLNVREGGVAERRLRHDGAESHHRQPAILQLLELHLLLLRRRRG